MFTLFLQGQSDEDVKEVVFDAYLEGIKNGLFDHGFYLGDNFEAVTKLALDLASEKQSAVDESNQDTKSRLVGQSLFEAMLDALRCGTRFDLNQFRNLKNSVTKTLYPEEHGQNAE